MMGYMMKRGILTALAILAFILPASLAAAQVNYAMTLHGGMMPSLGGDLMSYEQGNTFGSNTGIDGINNSAPGFDTSPVDRLLGASVGLTFKVTFYGYFHLRVGGNYFQSVYGGTGKAVYYDNGTTANQSVKCEYSMWGYDIPVTIGLTIPFWKDMKISFSTGLAYAYGVYTNKFESDVPFEYKGEFKGWALPLVIHLEGEYFLTRQVALYTSLSYYNGSTNVLADKKDDDAAGNTDYASIDFTGYRFNLGVSYYFKPI